jgi:predicted nucleic acid-binding Zn ribbon protein
MSEQSEDSEKENQENILKNKLKSIFQKPQKKKIAVRILHVLAMTLLLVFIIGPENVLELKPYIIHGYILFSILYFIEFV